MSNAQGAPGNRSPTASFFTEIDRGGVLSSLYRSKILNKANHRAPGLCGSLGGSGAKPAPWGAPEAGSLGGPAAKPAPWGAPVEPAPWGAQGGSRLLGGRRTEAGSFGGAGGKTAPWGVARGRSWGVYPRTKVLPVFSDFGVLDAQPLVSCFSLAQLGLPTVARSAGVLRLQ